MMERRAFQLLSIVVPVFNEEVYLEDVIRKVALQFLPGDLDRELILVNDASTDGTWQVIQTLPAKFPGTTFQVVNKSVNEGKGAALRDGFAKVNGDIVIIQDADDEYDPADYPKLLQPILDRKADVVFGSRFIGEPHRVMYFWHQLGNNILTLFSNIFTNLNLTDMEVCYKVFVRGVIDKIRIKSSRFGVEPEITAKIARLRLNDKRVRIYETGVSYAGRTYEEGKKINWTDAISAIIQIIRFRFVD